MQSASIYLQARLSAQDEGLSGGQVAIFGRVVEHQTKVTPAASE